MQVDRNCELFARLGGRTYIPLTKTAGYVDDLEDKTRDLKEQVYYLTGDCLNMKGKIDQLEKDKQELIQAFVCIMGERFSGIRNSETGQYAVKVLTKQTGKSIEELLNEQ